MWMKIGENIKKCRVGFCFLPFQFVQKDDYSENGDNNSCNMQLKIIGYACIIFKQFNFA